MVIPTFSWLERMAKDLWIVIKPPVWSIESICSQREGESIRKNQKIDDCCVESRKENDRVKAQTGKTTSGKKRTKGILLESHGK